MHIADNLSSKQGACFKMHQVTCLKAAIFANCLLLRCSDVAEMQQPEDWSKMGSQTLGQAQPSQAIL